MSIIIEIAKNGWLLTNVATNEKFIFGLGELDGMLAQVAKWCGRTSRPVEVFRGST